MTRNPSPTGWFFPIEEAPVHATVTHQGVASSVLVPRKKALVAPDTGKIVGIGGARYKVFTNREALDLCQKFSLEAFPNTKPPEWTFAKGHGPGTRSWAALDIQHGAHATNMVGIEAPLRRSIPPSSKSPTAPKAVVRCGST